MSEDQYRALVLSASGLPGRAVVEELLPNYPTEGAFAKVTALVNRSLKAQDTYWPLQSPERPELQLVDGANLPTQGNTGRVRKGASGKGRSISHVYYFAFKQEDDLEFEIKTNCGMLERLFIAWPSGTMGYGIYHKGRFLKAPLPHQGETSTRIGFAPSGSTYSFAAHWAAYFSLYALVEGQGAKVPLLGTKATWTAPWTDASSSTIARTAIWASLHPDSKTAGELFNIADDEYANRHAHVWQGGHLDRVGYHMDFDKQLSLERAQFTEEPDTIQSWLNAYDRFKAAGMVL
ncbi:hypothetical protein NEOLEDRAFT_1159550 [Neolentinus lepideus HHB14362 ss-1]|uniref:PRISE-like Rossmann-fold domain-containing protein n=1 Tax=Neolentinus lepideus HHB14362 ss-1 TaxID=1314782 RepID=A0A165M9K4_9AGAM|nr:hypothetical protein NEOLEDRAFT_1159550 [Neolentinus lepideus HHB14362 ss-1]